MYTEEAGSILDDLEKNKALERKLKKVRKALRLLSDVGPSHPGLRSHKYSSVTGPGGEDVWESYIENNTPSAWRLFWIYGPGADEITVVTLGPHP
jgi:hypothetical protein